MVAVVETDRSHPSGIEEILAKLSGFKDADYLTRIEPLPLAYQQMLFAGRLPAYERRIARYQDSLPQIAFSQANEWMSCRSSNDRHYENSTNYRAESGASESIIVTISID